MAECATGSVIGVKRDEASRDAEVASIGGANNDNSEEFGGVGGGGGERGGERVARTRTAAAIMAIVERSAASALPKLGRVGIRFRFGARASFGASVRLRARTGGCASSAQWEYQKGVR